MRYDATLKSIFQSPPQRLLRLLTGQEAREFLPVEFPSVKARQPDLLVRLLDDSLLHLELQSGGDPDMDWRMLEYYIAIRRQFPGVPLLQMVLHVGPGPLTMPTKIEETHLSFRYTVRDIREIDCQQMLMSPCLEENLLAVLCRLENGRETIREILTRIAALPPKARADALEKLVILAGLRRLDRVVKEEFNDMPITVDVMENAFLRDVFAKGEMKGELRGEQRGEQRGELKGKRLGEADLILRQLNRRFGALPDWVETKLQRADLELLDQWGDRLLDARTLEEVFQ